ncbi:SGNH/GDSL hydrolase family protein [Streptomyces sp. NBC_00249]|uniref:SGNH/GDSL hydrolase family protein n=1 Tax=Streptomyces sp. NBC_00249 TaxID=2975690 RepID=UPI00225C0D98|nr:SGNH/GDSL hydrolase family protein [Streptomyces sp. NBC_00249]MCX5194689.1 SGNH/GDSL hydrolase family protein [Streptomyces sp. NBC_00249]
MTEGRGDMAMNARARTTAGRRIALAAAATALTVAAAALTPASAAPGAPAASLDYVALGDSYSAGVFVRPWDGGDGCGRSEVNYPRQAARRLKVRLTDVTCSAAEVRAGLLEPQTELKGPPSVPPPGGWGPRPAQVRAVSADTDLVTVGIGGNSVGFADIVRTCVERGLGAFGLGSPCSAHYSRGAAATALEERFTTLRTDFTALLAEIRTRAPKARVAVVGYPAVVDDGAGCGWGSWHQLGTVAKGDMPWLDSVERRLNGLLREQAGRSGAAYVDTYASSTGHGVCASGEQRWMYGIKDSLTGEGAQSDPPGELCRSIPAPGEACTVLHPNLRGTTHQAELVTRALTELGASRI